MHETDFLLREGARAFGTRLRRLYEDMTQGVLAVYRNAGIDFEPRWFGLITLVRAKGEIEVAKAAEALGQSHVAIVQVANALEQRKLLRRTTSPNDKRCRMLALTPKGNALCKQLDPLWDTIGGATEQLLREAAPDFLANIAALEAALSKKPLKTRIRECASKTGGSR